MKVSGISWPVLSASARVGFADFRAIYTWRSWLFGWFGRLITQAIFFTSFGLWLGSHAAVDYMAVGNTMMLIVMECLAVIGGTVGERFAGTIPLQLAASGNFIASYLARSSYCILVGLVSSSVAFYGLTAAFSVPLVWPASALVPLLILLTGFAVYCFGFAVASAVMSAPTLALVAINFSYLSMMTFCGVNVPVGYWPTPVQAFAQAFPVTHGLLAVRELISAAPVAEISWNCLLTLVVGLGWMTVGIAAFRFSVHAGRRKGTLELSA
jgi:ABC-2 type transport system permease protein